MLAFLHIRGLAVIEQLKLELSPGLNVLTGETGAGKSIIVGALGLLRGNKALRGNKGSHAVRSSAEHASVQAQFLVPQGAPVVQLLREFELPLPETDEVQPNGAAAEPMAGAAQTMDGEAPIEVLLSRAVARTGRGRCMLQGELRPGAQLSRVGECLIDICSQHQQHSLARLSRHLELLDEHAGAYTDDRPGRVQKSAEKYQGHSFAQLLELYRGSFTEVRRLERELERVNAVLRRDPELGEYLRHQLAEFERVDPQPGEWEGVGERLRALRDGVRLTQLAELLEVELELADGAVQSRLGALERALRAAGERFEPLTAQLAVASSACEEVLVLARRLCLEEPAEESLEVLEERQHELATLRRKHGEDLQAARARLAAQVEEWDTAAERARELEGERARAMELAASHARELHARRSIAARKLAKALEAELASLHMPHARIEIGVELLPLERLNAAGLDRVEIRVAANPGEPAGALSSVASGGELSRILLALQSVSKGRGGVSTYVFDEVDAGVGGAVADAIGRRLLRAARTHASAQVLCITHLPQVAAFADAHYRVEKYLDAGRTHTRVVRLSQAERVEELARMLGGAAVTETAREHARRLLAEAAAAESRGGARVRRAAALPEQATDGRPAVPPGKGAEPKRRRGGRKAA